MRTETSTAGRRRGRPRKNNYLTSEEIMPEYEHWKQTGVVSEKMGAQMITLARHVMEGPKFNGYPDAVKDDIISDSYVKIQRNLHNFNPEKGNIFNYWTTCIYTAAITYLRKYYERRNKDRRLLLDALADVQNEMPHNPYLQQVEKNLKSIIDELDNAGERSGGGND